MKEVQHLLILLQFDMNEYKWGVKVEVMNMVPKYVFVDRPWIFANVVYVLVLFILILKIEAREQKNKNKTGMV